MESEFFSIPIEYYQKIASTNSYFDETFYFDQKYGISYLGLDEKKRGHFLFRIVDKQKFLLAKIKYGF
jgi:hypothetical protein